MAISTRPHIHTLIMCANIFVRKDGRYLLLKRSDAKQYAPGFVHPIGGKIDANEDPLIAARREVLEEAGITVKNIRLEAVISEITPVPGERENWMVFHFSGDYDSGTIGETEEGELVMLAPDEIKASELFPSVREVIDHILNPSDGTAFLTVEYGTDGKIISGSKVLTICAK